MSKKSLDFIVVGAQKGGTTSLAEYMGKSAEIFVPKEKEIPYFLDSDFLQRGWDWYLKTFFKNADPAKLWGTSTPQYMMNPAVFKSIKEKLPNVKIIVILRDPIARLISHFDMMLRLGVEQRSLVEVIDQELADIESARCRPYPEECGKYIVSGEYGRILTEVFIHFDQANVHVLFFDDLIMNAQLELDEIAAFLNIKRVQLGRSKVIRMRGGSKKRVLIDHNKINELFVKFVRVTGVGHLIPYAFKRRYSRIISWIDENNVDPSSKTNIAHLPASLLLRLKAHYMDDSLILRCSGISAPWLK